MEEDWVTETTPAWLRDAARDKLAAAERQPAIATVDEKRAFFAACTARETRSNPELVSGIQISELSVPFGSGALMNRCAGFLLVSLSAIATRSSAQESARQLTRAIEFYNPDWSPDGRTLLFESTLDGKFSIYAVHVDGTGLHRLTVDNANNEQPRWSPDGRRIVFSSDRAGHLDLYLMNADGSGQTRLTTTSGGGYYQSSFSPDGSWILFQGRADNRETRDGVYLTRSDGSGWRRISDSAYGAEGPKWSPDGRTITFNQVFYPKRFWSEMAFADFEMAKQSAQIVSGQPDGTGFAPVRNRPGDSRPEWTRNGSRAFFISPRDGAAGVYELRRDGTVGPRVADAGVVADPNPSPDAHQFAYTKVVDGASGLFLYDIATRVERLLVGGRGAGPLGYLRTATLTARVDTIDTYESAPNGPIERGAASYVIRVVRPVSGQRWELVDTWYDSAGHETARQYARTAPRSVATELETVHAPSDSAAMLVTSDRVTAWVVPQGGAPRLYDSAAVAERYHEIVVASAVARTHAAAGSVFLFTGYSLFGGPLTIRVDSIRVVRRDTLYRGQVALPVVVLERSGGGQVWVDETTGGELLSRGSAGPDRWWWHIRRGVTPPVP